MTPDGKISTYAQFAAIAWDMKRTADGAFYVGAEGAIIRISPSGAQSQIAGTDTLGFSGDEGPATGAQLGEVSGLALDAAGNIYFTDVWTTDHIREITTDGKIHTIAGAAPYGFNGDNRPAASASFYNPTGIAVDSSGNIYVADTYNSRVRKFTVGGPITTIAGNGNYGPPANGPATAGPLGSPSGLWLDSSGNIYVADSGEMVVVKITPQGTLSVLAGNFHRFGAPGDGRATACSLDTPVNVSADSSGNLYIAQSSHLVRKLTQDGFLSTIAGKLHFDGDHGPAAALLNAPDDVALDPSGNAFIADGSNYRIRKVAADGTITTWGGDGIPDLPVNGSPVASTHLPYIYSVASDQSGALYLGIAAEVLKVAAGGKVSVLAGTGDRGDSGDGGLATAAHLGVATGIAVDASGNVYVADAIANRVRVIPANTGTIQRFAGSGSHGFSGDGGLATSAQLDIRASSTLRQTPLAVDGQGNVYIGDAKNHRVRMVTPQGIISTVVGNGNSGVPSDGAQAATAPFSDAGSMAVDSAGNLYIGSHSYMEIYRVSSGQIRRISGLSFGSLADGSPAASAVFPANGLKVDANGDLYAADAAYNTIRKLILNSPVSFTIADGDNQTAQPGQVLPKALKVRLMGRAGVGISGVIVNFTVTSGSATLSVAGSATDADGMAGVAVTLPAAAGNIVITATAAGTAMSPVQFTETATAPAPACSVPRPAVSSVNSAGDFGGSSLFAPGSWLEIKGTNLAQTTRPWGGGDFSGSTAPTSLDGVTVTIGAKPAFVAYVSPTQINVQAPADTAAGEMPLVVTTASCPSASVTVQEAALAPGLLAPSAFRSGATQYLAATFSGGAFVGIPGLIPGVSFRPAAPGDTITAYGIGFGPTAPPVDPGAVTAAASSLANLAVAFGSTPATVTYAGLAPGTVGLYQFNIVVPGVPDGDTPVTFQIGATKVPQTVYLTVHR